jgi:hypothetical protein
MFKIDKNPPESRGHKSDHPAGKRENSRAMAIVKGRISWTGSNAFSAPFIYRLFALQQINVAKDFKFFDGYVVIALNKIALAQRDAARKGAD